MQCKNYASRKAKMSNNSELREVLMKKKRVKYLQINEEQINQEKQKSAEILLFRKDFSSLSNVGTFVIF